MTYELTALDFRAPKKNQYKYTLVGYDKDWIDNGVNRTNHYTDLPPGKYTLTC